VSGQVNVIGNVTASNFLGNLVSSGNISALNILGNIIATGNVNAANITTANLRVSGQVNVVGNVIASNFVGNLISSGNITASFFLGNVVARGNVDAADVTAGNLSVSGQVNVIGNVIASNFIGNLVSSGNISAPFFLGNVIARGNVDAANVTAGNLRVSGQVNVVGNALATNFIGNLVSTGNISASFFLGNVVAPGNVDAANAVFVGNLSVTGNVNVNGNVFGRYFLGDVIAPNVFLSGSNIVTTNFVANTANISGDIFIGSGNVSMGSHQRFPSFIGFSYSGTGNISYASGSFQTLTFASQRWDPRGLWTGSSFTAPVSGYYMFIFTAFVEDGTWILRVLNNTTSTTLAWVEAQRGSGAQAPQYQHPLLEATAFVAAGQQVVFQMRPYFATNAQANGDDYMAVAFLGGA
jgi:cytoskeletal protein CcmA (bactofilin family)